MSTGGRTIAASAARSIAGAALAAFAVGAAGAASAAQGPPPPGAPATGGERIFNFSCAACHKPEGVEGGVDRAPRLETLRSYPPDRIVDSLTTGVMRAQGARLSLSQHREIAEWLTGKKAGNLGADLASMGAKCVAGGRPAGVSGWNGWSPRPDNARFQTTAAGGVSAAEAPKLRLRWAFGIPGSAQLQSQPTIAGGWLFIGSDSGTIFALDADSGCWHWTAKAEAGVRTAPIVAPLDGKNGPLTVFVGDRRGSLYAYDAATGKALWNTKIDPDPANGASITAAPVYYAGRLYVGLTGTGEGGSSTPCCRGRGQVAAVDTATGRIIWKTYTVKEAVETSPGKFGPSGVGVWSTPTVDPKRRRIYVTTGNAYSGPAPEMENAVIAMDMATGRIAWVHQEVPNDIWRSGCVGRPGAPGCPDVVGPDYDFASSAMLRTLPNGQDVLIAANKGGAAIALDANRGSLVWRTQLWTDKAPSYFGDVLFGGAADASKAYFALQESNAVMALNLRDGKQVWATPFKAIAGRAQRSGFGAAVSAIPGVVFVGGWDGVLHALSAADGTEVWSFDTARTFQTNNGVIAKGGSLGGPGVTIANGMVYAASGYVGVSNGMPGNVLLAFSP